MRQHYITMTVDLNGILIHAKSIFGHFFNFLHTTEMEVLNEFSINYFPICRICEPGF